MKKTLVTIVMIILLIGVSGCRGLNWSEEIKVWQDAVKIPVEEDGIEFPEADLIQPPTAAELKVELYFERQDGRGLAIEEREIPKVEGIARATVEELLKGPGDNKLVSPFPPGTCLLDINIKPNGNCVIDLSSHIKKVRGAHGESLAVYSIVNTLSQFPSVDTVTFLVEGETVETIGGHLNTAEPVTADFSLSEEEL